MGIRSAGSITPLKKHKKLIVFGVIKFSGHNLICMHTESSTISNIYNPVKTIKMEPAYMGMIYVGFCMKIENEKENIIQKMMQRMEKMTERMIKLEDSNTKLQESLQ